MRPRHALLGASLALLPSCTETVVRCADGAVTRSESPLRCELPDASPADVSPEDVADASVDACVAADEAGDAVDSNCDGVDGVRDAQVYVSAEMGSDAPGNGLSPDRPLRSFGAALRAAESASRGVILVGAGDYPFALEGDAGTEVTYVLRRALRVHGGYAPGWTRRAGAESVIRGLFGGLAVEAAETDDVTLTDLTVRGESPGSGARGDSVFGLVVLRARSVHIERVRIFAGRGGNGAPGMAGSVGAPGETATLPVGASGCMGASGGNGGNGGNGPTPATAGVMGTSLASMGAGSAGGGGGPGASSGAMLDGQEGTRGGTGADGADGEPVAIGQFLAVGGYDPARSGAGRGGSPGGGGGGGGGGGAMGAGGLGGRGGGGGGGGCGGAGGEGGGGGGASVGIMVVGSVRLVVRASSVNVEGGGDGGNGGAGGDGGGGGMGAAGEAGARGGRGGPGGAGGAGGRGGVGGRGAGGPTLGVLRGAGSVDIDEATTFTLGMGGAPGMVGGGILGRGVSQRVYMLP